MTSREEALMALEKRWRGIGDELHEKSKRPYAAETDKMHNLCEGDLAHQFAHELKAILATASEQAPVAWVIVDSDGTKSFAQKEIDAAPWTSEPGFTVRPLIYGASPAQTSEAMDAARLDWLEKNGTDRFWRKHNNVPKERWYDSSSRTEVGCDLFPTLREAIDAAMRQEAGDD
jgi:hypothetical protein